MLAIVFGRSASAGSPMRRDRRTARRRRPRARCTATVRTTATCSAGTWLYRGRPDQRRDRRRLVRGTSPRPTAGRRSRVPNSYNAGDFSADEHERLGRLVSTGLHAPHAARSRATSRATAAGSSASNRSTTAPPCGSTGARSAPTPARIVPFEFALTGLRSGVNRLVVRVDDRRTAADLPPGPGGGWWNFGGILREVYLRAVQRADLSQVDVRPILPCLTLRGDDPASRSLVRNSTGAPADGDADAASYGSGKLNFGGSTRSRRAARWTAPARRSGSAHPQLWAPGDPYLYRHADAVGRQGRQLRGYFTYSGIRTITVGSGGQSAAQRPGPGPARRQPARAERCRPGAAIDAAQLRS